MKSSHKKTYWILGIISVLLIISLLPLPDMSFGPKIGIIEINTPIMGSKKIVNDLNTFEDDTNIDAIIVRLNTPGGGVAASQEIFEKVKSISEKNIKPIIASMGGVAASGGYYIALGADTIIANPGTATGSIGVIMGYPIAHELLEKIGIGYQTIKSGKLKDSGSSFREVTEEDRTYFQSLVDNLHLQFVTAVATQRGLPLKDVKSLATGQVYSGEQAFALELIDVLGTFEDAIHLATQLAGYEKRPELVYPEKEKSGFIDLLFGKIKQQLIISYLDIYPYPEFTLYYGGRNP